MAAAAFEQAGHQFRARPLPDVGARSVPRHVQGNQLGRIDERLLSLGRQRLGDGRPHRPEDLVAGSHADSDPGLEIVGCVGEGDVDGPVGAVQLAECAEALKLAGVALGNLAPEHGFFAGLGGLVWMISPTAPDFSGRSQHLADVGRVAEPDAENMSALGDDGVVI